MEDKPLLGFLDQKIKNELSERDAHKINKVGGQPVFSACISPKSLNDLKSQLHCDQCQSSLIFIMQIFCPLQIDCYDRILYVFACNGKACDSWKIFRCIFQDPQDCNIQENKPQEIDDQWGDDEANDWGDSNSFEPVDAFQEEIVSNQVGDSEKSRFILLPESEDPKLIAYYLDAELEQDKPEPEKDKYVEDLLKKYEQNKEEGISNVDLKDYDETNLLENYNDDEVTYKFYKRIKQYPSQVLRYHWNQQPLLNASNVQIPRTQCSSCGADTYFEMQLMPAIINFLRFVPNKASSSVNYTKSTELDFATVLVFTCSKNCNQNEFTEESFIVLKENDEGIAEILAE